MAILSISRGFDFYVALKEETNGGTAEENFNTGAITLAITALPEITQNIVFENDAQFRQSESWFGRIKTNHEQAESGLSVYLKGSGSFGTAPPTDLLLKSLFGQRSSSTASSTVQSGSTATSVIIPYADTSNYAVGDLIAWNNGNFWEVARIESKTDDATNGITTLDVKPGFSADPAANDTIYKGYKYSFVDRTLPQFTMRISDGVRGAIGVGMAVNTFELSLGIGIVGVTFGLVGLKKIVANSATLAANITSTDTSITINEEWNIEAGAIIKIGSEEMKVDAVSSDGVTLTVTRGYNGTTAASHNADDVIQLAMPALTVTGSPQSAKFANVELWDRSGTTGTRTLLNPTSVSLSVNRNVNALTDELRFNYDPRGFSITSRREITGSFELYYVRDRGAFEQWNKQNVQKEFIIFTGADLDIGNQFVFYVTNARFNTPGFSGEENVTTSTEWQAYATSGADELELWVF